MEKIVRLLMWAHYLYLLLLPTLAATAAQMLFPGPDLTGSILIFGFPSVLMYSLFLANGYALPASLPLALLVTLVIPLQIALSVFLFGGDSGAEGIWIFFAESGCVEIGSFVAGTLFSAFAARRADTPGGCFILLAALAVIMFCGGIGAYCVLVYYAYGGLSGWLILFATSFAAACWEYAKVYQKVVVAHRKTGAAQTVEMTFDGGFLAKILGIETEVPLVAPFRHHGQKTEPTRRILIFGFTAAFLPVVVSLLLEVAR